MSSFKLNGESLNIVDENISKLKVLFPEMVNGDNEIDFDAFREIFESNGEIITDDYEEHYKFTWWGKKEAKKVAKQTTTKTLRPSKRDSKNWEETKNIYIEGDNLDALKILLGSYRNKIKMIYIDPPYNTGHDFVYKDDRTESTKEHLESTGQLSEDGYLFENAKADGKYHSNWLNMMYPRLTLARKLLTDDGVIFISIGDDEFANLKNICDEIFGEGNFISSFVRVSKKGSSMGKFVSPSYDWILCYVKNINTNPGFVFPQTEEYIAQFNLEDLNGKYKTKSLYQSSLDPLRGCNNQRYFIECPDGSLVIPPGDIFPEIKKDGEKIAPKSRNDKVWRWSAETYLHEKENLVFKKSNSSPLVDENNMRSLWNVSTKQYLKGPEESKVVPGNLIENSLNSEATGELKSLNIPFDFAKPVSLIKYLAQVCNVKDNDIILDFFSGSGTSAESVFSLNSMDNKNISFILVQIPELVDDKSPLHEEFENICEIGKERIRRAGEKILEETDNDRLDIGFKVFKVDESNFIPWNAKITSENVEQAILGTENNLVQGRSELDLVYELLLKHINLDLNCPVDEVNVNGKKVYIIDNGYALICLENKLDVSIADELLKLKEELMVDYSQVILKDEALDDNSSINIYETLKSNGVEFYTI